VTTLEKPLDDNVEPEPPPRIPQLVQPGPKTSNPKIKSLPPNYKIPKPNIINLSPPEPESTKLKYTILLLRSALEGIPISIILAEDSSGYPKIISDKDANDLKCSLHTEGAELVAGMQRWRQKLEELGSIKANHLDRKNNKDLTTPESWNALKGELEAGSYSAAHAIVVSGQTQNLSKLMEEVLTGIYAHIKKGGFASLESPIISNLWNCEWFKGFVKGTDMHFSVTDKCRWGLGSQERTRLCSNIPKENLRTIESKRCSCGTKPHVRRSSRYNSIADKGWVYNRTPESVDQPHFAAALAQAYHQAWEDRLLTSGLLSLKLANINTAKKTGPQFNSIDSAAEKMFLCVGKEGNWEETEIQGTIECEGFNKSSSRYNLSKAQTVVTTKLGETIILAADQAVTHENPNMSSLIDPSAAAHASWAVHLNFDSSSGTIEYGRHVVDLMSQGAGIGFPSRQPTAREKLELIRIPFSITDYNKKKFLSEGNRNESQHGFKIQQCKTRNGTEFTKSKFKYWHNLLLVVTTSIILA
jgi:hypothetical protein